MRSLLHFLALCAVVTLSVCYDSHESSESNEDLFMPPNRANSFISSQRGNIFNPPRGNGFGSYNLRRRTKSPAEIRVETCEDFTPCRFYAYRHGYPQAFRRFFGAQNQAQQLHRPTRIRRF